MPSNNNRTSLVVVVTKNYSSDLIVRIIGPSNLLSDPQRFYDAGMVNMLALYRSRRVTSG